MEDELAYCSSHGLAPRSNHSGRYLPVSSSVGPCPNRLAAAVPVAARHHLKTQCSPLQFHPLIAIHVELNFQPAAKENEEEKYRHRNSPLSQPSSPDIIFRSSARHVLVQAILLV